MTGVQTCALPISKELYAATSSGYILNFYHRERHGVLFLAHPRDKIVGAKNLEGLSTLGRLDFEGLLLFMYPNFIL